MCAGQNVIFEYIHLNNAYKDNLQIAYYCDDNNENCDISINIGGQNHKYTHIVDAIMLFRGTPEETYSFLQDIESFYNKNIDIKNIHTTIWSHLVSKTEVQIGKRKPSSYITIYEDISASSGYRTYFVETIIELREKLEQWAKENDINLKYISAKADLNNSDNSNKNIIDKLKEAKELLDNGVITEDEFSQIKKKLLE